MSDIIFEEVNGAGLITLNRAGAMNALSVSMIRTLTHQLKMWERDENIKVVAIRGRAKNFDATVSESNFGNFCSGGDIRFFYDRLLENTPKSLCELLPFFEDEYELDLLIANYSKPYIAFMTGITMGGGMGITQGAAVRVVSETTKIAMPETAIGLIPDVGAGYFLNRCPDHIGLYLALTGEAIDGVQAMVANLADAYIEQKNLAKLWCDISAITSSEAAESLVEKLLSQPMPSTEKLSIPPEIKEALLLISVEKMVMALEKMPSEAAQKFIARLRSMSPLALELTLIHLKKAKGKTLSEVLDQDRVVVKNCFIRPDGMSSEIFEGVRAKIIDKDNKPKWNPASLHAACELNLEVFFK